MSGPTNPKTAAATAPARDARGWAPAWPAEAVGIPEETP